MSEPTLPTIKRLFAFSGNRCAFPECQSPIVEVSGTPTGIICHIKARSPGGPRYDSKQTPELRNSFENLILLCARHSKLIDSEPKRFTVEYLTARKSEHERNGSIELSRADAIKAETLLKDYRAIYINITASGHVMMNSPGAVQGQTVNIKTTKHKVQVLPADGTIGFDVPRRNYVKHLIDRYNEFASKQPNRRTPFSFAAIYALIKKQFGADWERVPLNQFDRLAETLQVKIGKTRLGSINRGKGIPNYSSFDDYCVKYGFGQHP